MFKHIKHDIYGCEVSFAVELPLYLKSSFKHLLCDCENLEDIWNNLEQIINYTIDPDAKLDKFTVIAGLFERSVKSNICNMIISICRWIIWKRRNSKKFENVNVKHNRFKFDVKHEINDHINILMKTGWVMQDKEILSALTKVQAMLY